MNTPRLFKLVKRHGLWRTAIAYSFGLCKKMLDFEVLQVQTASAGPMRSLSIEPYVARKVSAEEYREGIKTLEGDHERQWAFDRGDWCFASFLGGELVAYIFYAFLPTPVRPGLAFRFSEGFTYVYAAYTAPDHRGHRLAQSCADVRRQLDLSNATERLVVWYVAVDNIASRTYLTDPASDSLVGYLAYLRIGKRFFRFSSPGCKRSGITLVPSNA